MGTYVMYFGVVCIMGGILVYLFISVYRVSLLSYTLVTPIMDTYLGMYLRYV